MNALLHAPLPSRMRPLAGRASYDHRLRRMYVATRDETLLEECDIPASTARSWIKRGAPNIVTLDHGTSQLETLEIEVRRLQRRNRKLIAALRLFIALVAVRGARLDPERLPKGETKRRLLRAVDAAGAHIGLKSALKILGLDLSRYHRWKRAHVQCGLDGLVDKSSCPRSNPKQLSATELLKMKALVLCEDLKHMTTTGLSVHAKRIGALFASSTSWARTIRKMGWRRPRFRVHPRKPKVGIRATRPNEYWHIDVTIVRLLDGTKAFVQGIIDNFSRKLLAFQVTRTLKPSDPPQLIREAGRLLPASDHETRLVVDDGWENKEGVIGAELERFSIKREVAKVDIVQSNSMIEAFWNSLKHNWLFLHKLDSVETVRQLVDFYVQQHNSVMTHSGFQRCPERRSRTPDEVYFGRASGIHDELREQHLEAMRERVIENKNRSCSKCHNSS